MAPHNNPRKFKKRKLMAFSFTMLALILIAGGVAYVVSMKNIVNSGKKGYLRQILEIERFKLEASVNNGIALVLKMASSQNIQQYFANPADPDLESLAFGEIADFRRALAGTGNAGNALFWVNDIDKKFYFDTTYAFTVDPENPANYWYSLTLDETEKYNVNINYNPDLKETKIWINTPVLDGKGKPIGMLGTGINLEAFIESIYKNYSGNATLYFFNELGEITGARDAGLVADKIHIHNLLGKTGEKIIRSSDYLHTGEIDSFIVKNGVVAVGAVPAFNWNIAVIQPINMLDYIRTDIIIFIIVLALIALALAVFNVMS